MMLAQICRLACLVGLIQGTNGDNDESCIEHARTALVGQQVNEPFLIMGIQSCCESSHLCEPGTYEWILLNVAGIHASFARSALQILIDDDEEFHRLEQQQQEKHWQQLELNHRKAVDESMKSVEDQSDDSDEDDAADNTQSSSPEAELAVLLSPLSAEQAQVDVVLQHANDARKFYRLGLECGRKRHADEMMLVKGLLDEKEPVAAAALEAPPAANGAGGGTGRGTAAVAERRGSEGGDPNPNSVLLREKSAALEEVVRRAEEIQVEVVREKQRLRGAADEARKNRNAVKEDEARHARRRAVGMNAVKLAENHKAVPHVLEKESTCPSELLILNGN